MGGFTIEGSDVEYDFDVVATIDIIDYAAGSHIDFVSVEEPVDGVVSVESIGLLDESADIANDETSPERDDMEVTE